MPELPDVRAFMGYLQSTALHKKIVHTSVDEAVLRKGTSLQAVARAATGHSMEEAQAHGKHLFVKTGRKWLVFHFGMTGHFDYYECQPEDEDHTHADFELENGYHLAYVAPRKLGFVDVTDDVAGYIEKEGLGEDALRISRDRFVELMQNRRGMLKSALTNQAVVAGVGNVYADEILFQAGLHPKSAVKALGTDALRKLHTTMQRVLREAADRQANPSNFPDSWLTPRREDGAACPSCSGTIRRITVNGRGTYVCPSCQSELS